VSLQHINLLPHYFAFLFFVPDQVYILQIRMSKSESDGSTPPIEDSTLPKQGLTPLKESHVPAAADHEYERKIYSYAAEIREPHFLEFRHLQRINLAELQNSLARQKALFAKSESVTTAQLSTLQNTLHSYGILLQNPHHSTKKSRT